MPRRVPYHRIKSDRSYSLEQAADVLGVSIGTVRRWVRIEGLPCLDRQRPYLLLGWQLKDFLKERVPSLGRKLAPSEFYCLSCHAPREPLGMMADYFPINMQRGRLQALCGVCGGTCNRFVSSGQAGGLAKIFDLQINNSKDA